MKRRIFALSLLIPLLAGCGAPAIKPVASEGAAKSEGLPGYALGEMPPIPLVKMPDLSILDTAMAGFSIKVRDKLPNVPGVTIRPAHCDKQGTVETDTGSLELYGDGSGRYTTGNGEVVNNGKGTGIYSINGTTVKVLADGSGSYDSGNVHILTLGSGAGHYEDDNIDLTTDGNGAGRYVEGKIEISNDGDGGGRYSNGRVVILNTGSGAGTYSDENVEITNDGKGTGTQTNLKTREILVFEVKPLAPVPPFGDFPKMGALKPIKSCGTRITIDDSVLFDFNKDTLRSDSTDTIAKLAAAFTELNIRTATISGHTDSIGTDEYNQGLSERRADSVRQALIARNVATTLDAIGYGETKPVAPNQIKGKDNPAGRQANRRVEIFIPNS